MTVNAHNLMDFLNADNIITENVNDLILIIKKDKKIEYVNNYPLSTILGYDRDELIGKNLYNYIDAHDQKTVTEAFEKDFELDGIIHEIGLKKKDEAIISFELRVKKIDTNNKVKRFLIILRDISKQKRIEQELKESEEKLRSIMDGLTIVGIGVDVVSKDYKILFQNSILKGKFEDTDGKSCYEKYMGLEKSCDSCPMVKAIESNRITSIELKGIDGRNYEIISAPLPNLKGFIDKAIEVVLDITERKNLEEELKEHAIELEIINRIIVTGNKAENLSLALEEILNSTLSLMNFEGGGIYLVDETRQFAEVVCHNGLPLDFVEDVKKVRINEGNYKRIFIQGQPIITDNYYQVNPERSKKWGFLSLASIPLIAKDNIVGSLNFISKSRHVFSELEKKMFDSLSREIGTIIARIQAEQKLKESEKKYKQMINDLDVGFYKGVYKGELLMHNLALNKIFGLDPSKNLIGSKAAELFADPKDQEKYYELLEKEGFVKNLIAHIKKNNGAITTIQINSHLIKNYNNEPLLVEGTFFDISEQFRLEQELKESEEKYRLITENANDLIAVLNENFEHEFINEQTYLKILGYSSKDMLGKTNFDLVHPDDFKRSVNALQQGSIYGEGTIEARLKHKNGHYLWFEFKGRRFMDKEGKIKGLLIARDVNHRKEAEEKLKESEEKFRTIADQSLMGIAILQDDVFKYANQQYETINGYSFEELKSWKPGEYAKMIHPEDREMVLEQAKKKQMDLKEDIVNRYEFQGIKKSGETIWIEIFSKTITYEGKPADLIAIIDITDKKVGAQRLKEKETQYWNFFNNAQVGLGRTRISDGKALECNDVWAKLLGYENREECLAKYVAEDHYLDPNVRKELVSLLEKHGEVRNFEAYLIRNDGTTFWAAFSSRIYPEKGYLESAIIDIMKMKIAEQKLKESETKYRDLIETSSMALLEIDIINRKVIYVNPKLLDITGYTREELNDAKTFNNVVHPEDLEEIVKIREEKDLEFRIFTEDEKIKWLSGRRLTYFSEQGELMSIRLWLQDITERKFNEKIKEDFLRRISHELKTPLVSIKGFSDLLLMVHKDKLDPYVISILNEIKQGGNRLENLINNILETSKLESGQVQLNKTLEDLSFLIGFSVRMFQGLAETRHIIISSNVHDKLITKFEKEKIHEVIGNLLTNAIKYTPPNGRIEIRSEITKDYYIISIKDSGIGLTEEEKKQLFKQFGKIERYGQGWDIGIGGSGLGLYISKTIVELHGGKIWVESEGRNKGSTFHFSLPIIVD